MTALVLSAGGMYGAYQAGAWKAIADIFQPDLVVGASIGAINGWAIAGGCHPDQLIERWLNLDAAAHYRWKFPRTPLHGVFDTTALQATIRDVYESFQPQRHFAMVLTDLLKLRPVVLPGTKAGSISSLAPPSLDYSTRCAWTDESIPTAACSRLYRSGLLRRWAPPSPSYRCTARAAR